jgi:hypothetical protein
VLQSGAIAAGFVWTAPVARTIRLGTAVGSPAPSTDPTEVTVTTPTYETTTTADTLPDEPTTTTESTTTTTQPHENPYSPCDLHTRSGCYTIGGSYDIVFEFRKLRPGRALRFVLDYVDGTAMSSTTLYGTADGTGTYHFAPGPTFPHPWSAAIALFDDVTGATLLRGSFSCRRRCTSGEFHSH